MATGLAYVSAGPFNTPHLSFAKPKCISLPKLPIFNKSRNHKQLILRARFSNDSHTTTTRPGPGPGPGGGPDFLAGFLLGGALCGTLAYLFAPQIRRSLLNEDEYGFRKARRPIYYDDEGLEKTRQTLNAKLSQLNAAIDNVSSRLRGVNNMPSMPVSSDPEVEAIM